MKSDEEPTEIINESIYENFGICHEEDILPLHEPHTRESYPTYSLLVWVREQTKLIILIISNN